MLTLILLVKPGKVICGLVHTEKKRFKFTPYINLPACHLAPLQHMQNTAARLITRTRKHDHITPVIRTLHWLLIPKRIQFKILLLTFNIIHHRAPSYLIELISPKQTTGMNLRSSSRPQLALGPRTHNRYGDGAFSVCAPTLWNTLPAHIQDSPTIDIFKKNLKTQWCLINTFWFHFHEKWVQIYTCEVEFYTQ